jgi:SAM-dependent methyltransferase
MRRAQWPKHGAGSAAYQLWRDALTWLARLYIWATVRLYHEFAWAYDLVSWLVSLGRWSSWRSSALDHVVGHQVLEVGFGTGELLQEMADRGLQAVGLELSPAMHRITTRKLSRRRLAIPRLRARVQAAPFADGSFDSIICTFPAGYILEPMTVREISRLLRLPDLSDGHSGGRLIVVGMVVGMDCRLWRQSVQRLFGVERQAVLARFERLAMAAGLRLIVVDQGRRGTEVPVVIAEHLAVSLDQDCDHAHHL